MGGDLERDGDTGQRDHLPKYTRPRIRGRHGLRAVLLRSAAGYGGDRVRVHSPVLQVERVHGVRVHWQALRSAHPPVDGYPLPDPALPFHGFHHLRAQHCAEQGAALAARLDLRVHRRTGDRVHHHWRCEGRGCNAQTTNGSDVRRALRGLRLHRASVEQHHFLRRKPEARRCLRQTGCDRHLVGSGHEVHAVERLDRRLLPATLLLRHGPKPGAALPHWANDAASTARAVGERLAEDPHAVLHPADRGHGLRVLPLSCGAGELERSEHAGDDRTR